MKPLKQNIDLLIEACKKKDQKAQMEIYHLYHKTVYHAAYRISKNREDAMDSMQEAFITAFEKLDQYEGKGSFEGWLSKIAIRNSLQHYHNKKRFFLSDRMEQQLQQETEDYSEEESLQTITTHQLDNALNQLNDRYQVILKLYYLEGYDYEEISRLLKWTPSNCRTTLSRARKQLKKFLNA